MSTYERVVALKANHEMGNSVNYGGESGSVSRRRSPQVNLAEKESSAPMFGA